MSDDKMKWAIVPLLGDNNMIVAAKEAIERNLDGTFLAAASAVLDSIAARPPVPADVVEEWARVVESGLPYSSVVSGRPEETTPERWKMCVEIVVALIEHLGGRVE